MYMKRVCPKFLSMNLFPIKILLNIFVKFNEIFFEFLIFFYCKGYQINFYFKYREIFCARSD